MKILFITQVIPYPPAGGEKIRSFGLLRSLIRSGNEVTAITPSLGNASELAQVLPGITFIPFDFEPASSLPGQFSGYFRRDALLLSLIGDLFSRERFDLSFIDYFFLGQYIPWFHKRKIPVIYGTHNAQSRLRIQQPAKGFTESGIRVFSYLAQAAHERLYFPQADHLICVSNVDRDFYSKFIPSGKLSVIPNFLDEDIYMPADSKKPYIVMTGNFYSFQNRQGLSWFIDNVWNEELENLTTLYLIGKGAEKIFAEVIGNRAYNNIITQDEPVSFTGVIAEAQAAIVPLWHGSGTRLKCIEAMALKTQLISTTIGAEGIDHMNSILISDTSNPPYDESSTAYRTLPYHNTLMCASQASVVILVPEIIGARSLDQ